MKKDHIEYHFSMKHGCIHVQDLEGVEIGTIQVRDSSPKFFPKDNGFTIGELTEITGLMKNIEGKNREES